MFAMTYAQIGDLVSYFLSGIAGAFFAITGPKYFHLFDKGFPEKRQSNPEAAAKQLRLFREVFSVIAVCSLARVIWKIHDTH